MTTNPKQLLTRREVEAHRADTTAVGCNNTEMITPEEKLAMLDTIERMAELLEKADQAMVCLVGWDEEWQQIHDLLATFNATGGEG